MNSFKTKYIKRRLQKKVIKENLSFYLQNAPMHIWLYLGIITFQEWCRYIINLKILSVLDIYELNSTKKVRRITLPVLYIYEAKYLY